MAERIIDMPDDCLDEWQNAYYPDERHDPMPIGEHIVRCRDCKRVTIDQGDHDYREPLWCSLFHIDVSLDGFCKWGERNEVGA